MLKHISPQQSDTNGVAVYGSIIDGIIKALPDSILELPITHFELGYSGYHELWAAWRHQKQPGEKLVLTLHDPPTITGKPFMEFLPSDFIAIKSVRKMLDITLGHYVIRQVIAKADALIVLNPLAVEVVSNKFNVNKNNIFTLRKPPLE